MFALVKGQIIMSTITQPTDKQGNPIGVKFVEIHLMQFSPKDGKPDLVKIKDYDLEAKYNPGTTFNKECSVTDWAYGGRNGLSVKVINDALENSGENMPPVVNTSTSPQKLKI